jgi:type II secretory pathway predicted ATPase ExeA
MSIKKFGFKEEPFDLTSDPRFIFVSPEHLTVYARLFSAVHGRNGIVLLTGEAGTGKTIMLRRLIQELDASGYRAHYFSNARESLEDLLRGFVQQSHGSDVGAQRDDDFERLLQTLTESAQISGTTVFVIDEAQSFPAETITGLLWLAKLEVGDRRPYRVVLCGLPGFERRLDADLLPEADVAVAERCRLEPLPEHEVEAFIKRRLGVAGGNNPSLFSADAVARIARYSEGIPRQIVVLSGVALQLTSLSSDPAVTVSAVERAAVVCGMKSSPESVVSTAVESPIRSRHARSWKVAGVVGLSLIGGGAVALWSSEQIDRLGSLRSLWSEDLGPATDDVRPEGEAEAPPPLESSTVNERENSPEGPSSIEDLDQDRLSDSQAAGSVAPSKDPDSAVNDATASTSSASQPSPEISSEVEAPPVAPAMDSSSTEPLPASKPAAETTAVETVSEIAALRLIELDQPVAEDRPSPLPAEPAGSPAIESDNGILQERIEAGGESLEPDSVVMDELGAAEESVEAGLDDDDAPPAEDAARESASKPMNSTASDGLTPTTEVSGDQLAPRSTDESAAGQSGLEVVGPSTTAQIESADDTAGPAAAGANRNVPSDALMMRGDELMARGDPASARLFFELAAQGGNPSGFTGVAVSYDPVFYETTGLIGASPDPARALEWYRRAIAAGDENARLRLTQLKVWLERAASRGDEEARRLLSESD